MRIITPKTDNFGDTLSAQIFNVNFITELNSFITKSGFSLDPEFGDDTDTAMIQKAAAMHACTPGMYQDASPSANNFVITRSGDLEALGDFYKEGQFLFFKAAFTNTAACTLKVDTYPVPIPLTFPDGTDLTEAAILKGRFSLVRYNGTDLRWELILSSHPILPLSHITGMVLKNDPGDLEHDIKFSVGQARASNAPFDLHFNTALTKKIDETWAAGDNVGGLFNGFSVPVAADTWYHSFIIRNDVTGILDAGFDLAGSGAVPLTPPAGWSVYKRVGSFRTDVSANIEQIITQELAGGAVLNIFKTREPDFAAIAGSESQTFITIRVPPDIAPRAKCSIGGNYALPAFLLVKNTSETNQLPTISLNNLNVNTSSVSAIISLNILADTSSQIAYRSSAAALNMLIITDEFTDHRND